MFHILANFSQNLYCSLYFSFNRSNTFSFLIMLNVALGVLNKTKSTVSKSQL